MRRTAGVALVAAALALGAGAADGAVVKVVTVSGGINPAVSDYLQKAIVQSEQEDAVALVIELDTPGGLLTSTKDIVSAILNARLPVVVFVSPRGAWAGSAGTFITLAGHVAAMAPGTSIGAAHPVSFLPGGQRPPEDEDAEEGDRRRDIAEQKIENFAAAFIESIAEERERNVEWAIEAVRESKAITQKEALELNVIDLVAADLDELLEVIDGRTVRVGRGEVTLATADVRVERIPMGAVNRLFDVLSDPQIALLLILAGLLGLYTEFSNPGLIVPGAVGVVCLILAGLALQIIPFNWIGLMLMLLGLGLIVTEVFVTSFGLLFAGGVLCLATGGYMIFDVPTESDLAVPFWEVVAPAVAAFAVFGAMVVWLLSRSLFRPQVAGLEGMVGSLALVEDDIDPTGRIFLHGETWTARADRRIERGSRVKITGVEDLVVRVAPASEEKGEAS
jgi:membrane-bound serine protease (ClpP class)